MTQKELIDWALSGVRQKQLALLDGYWKFKKSRPEVAEAIMKSITETACKRIELEQMKEALENV